MTTGSLPDHSGERPDWNSTIVATDLGLLTASFSCVIDVASTRPAIRFECPKGPGMKRHRLLRRHIRFRLDNALALGVSPVVAILGLIAALMIVGCAVIIVVGGIADSSGETLSFFESGWAALMRTIDPGSMGADRGWSLRVVSLIATVSGIFIISTLVGVITTAIDDRLTQLRSGRGPVELSGHTVVLGWSQGLRFILSELAEAGLNQNKAAVVVLADHDPQEMNSLMASMRKRAKHLQLVCRRGDTANADDLSLISAERAKAIIVATDDDADAVRTTLAVIHGLVDYTGRVVTQIADRGLAVALSEATRGRALAISSREVISKVAAQVCRFRGMTAVYQELLDFAGDEIYVQYEPRLVGATFSSVVMSYEDSMPIGLQLADNSIELCPDWQRVVGPGESIVAISQDDDTVVMSHLSGPVPVDMSTHVEYRHPPNHMLVIGWNGMANDLVSILESFLPDGSTVTICVPSTQRATTPEPSSMVTVVNADIDSSETLRVVLNQKPFDSILLLCSRQGISAEDDSRNLLRLVVLRSLLHEPDCASAKAAVVTELRDVSNMEIAGRADDEIFVSERLTSLLSTQLAANPDLIQVFEALFEPNDLDLVMVPGSALAPCGEYSFGDIVRSSMPHGLVIGVAERGKTTRLNLAKSESVFIRDGVDLVLLRRTDAAVLHRHASSHRTEVAG